MLSYFGFTNDFARMRMDELQREAENDRLADLVARPGRSARARLAEWLVALAARIDSQPRATSVARAEA